MGSCLLFLLPTTAIVVINKRFEENAQGLFRLCQFAILQMDRPMHPLCGLLIMGDHNQACIEFTI
jgi:hypothetical protein